MNEKEEKERQEQVQELVEFCSEILESRLPSSAPLDPTTLPDVARKLLAGREGRDGTGGERALRFNASWNKLDKRVSSDLALAV